MSRTVHLHVGVAKSGTTFLQRALFDNQALLAKHGVLYPGEHRGSHFLASMDLRESGFQGHTYPKAAGAWKQLVAEVDRFSGSAVISHETLARTPEKLVPQAVADFATDDVRVVITARDLGRQIPAVWQERLKNRNEGSYGAFLAEVLEVRGADRKGGFWFPQNVVGLARRWAAVVGETRVTVVTVPPPGAEKQELWRRFAAATELPDLEYAFDEGGSNPSLGVVESEFLRRLNPKVAELSWPEYETRIKKGFAEKTLVRYSNSGRLEVPASHHDDVLAVSEDMIGELSAAGFRVVGDLEDLRPAFGDGTGLMPDEVADAALLDLSLGLVGKLASARPARPHAPAPGIARRVARKARRRIARLGR